MILDRPRGCWDSQSNPRTRVTSLSRVLIFVDTPSSAVSRDSGIFYSELWPSPRAKSEASLSAMTSLFHASWKWRRGRAVKVEKGERWGSRCAAKKHTSPTHTHTQTAACEDGWHASRTYARMDTPTHKLQSKFLRPDITPLSMWLRGRETQIKREQRKGSEGREDGGAAASPLRGSAGNIQLTVHKVH